MLGGRFAMGKGYPAWAVKPEISSSGVSPGGLATVGELQLIGGEDTRRVKLSISFFGRFAGGEKNESSVRFDICENCDSELLLKVCDRQLKGMYIALSGPKLAHGNDI